MSGEWIKMRTALWTCPQVVRIASACCPPDVPALSARPAVVGALYRLWSIADEHSGDGNLPGWDAAALDIEVGVPGFAAAVKAAGWLVIGPDGLALPDFTEHNSASAKRRAQEATRKRNGRKASASDADKKRTRGGPEEEEEEEEQKAEPSAPPAARKRAARASAGNPVNVEFGRWWAARWEEVRGEPWRWSAKERAAVDRVRGLAAGDLQAMQAHAENMLGQIDTWTAQNAAPSLLVSRWNQYGAVVQRRPQSKTQRLLADLASDLEHRNGTS